MAQLSKTAAQIEAGLTRADDLTSKVAPGTQAGSTQTAATPYPGLPAGAKVSVTNGSTAIAGVGFNINTYFGNSAAPWGSFHGITLLVDGAWLTGVTLNNSGATVTLNSAWTGVTGQYELYRFAGSNATGEASQAFGTQTKASGTGAFSSGNKTVASGDASEAKGMGSVSAGTGSSAGGVRSVARSPGSRAHGGGYALQITAQGYLQPQILEYILTGGNGNPMIQAPYGSADQQYAFMPPDSYARFEGTIISRDVADGTFRTGKVTLGARRVGTGAVTVQNVSVVWDGGSATHGTLTATGAADYVNFVLSAGFSGALELRVHEARQITL